MEKVNWRATIEGLLIMTICGVILLINLGLLNIWMRQQSILLRITLLLFFGIEWVLMICGFHYIKNKKSYSGKPVEHITERREK